MRLDASIKNDNIITLSNSIKQNKTTEEQFDSSVVFLCYLPFSSSKEL